MRTLATRPDRLLSVVFAVWAVAAPTGGAGEAELRPETLAAWNTYVQTTERRVEQELAAPEGFLVLDFQPPDRRAGDRRAVMRGDVVVESMETRDASGGQIDIPSGTVQHWRGAVLLGGVSLDALMAALESGDTLRGQQDVLDWRILERGPGRMRVFLRLQRESIVTVTYATEHAVTYARRPGHAVSRSLSTRIAEIENAGKADEREKPPGQDRGFMWRLNAYWRYEETPDGVIAEVESLTLSRNIPLLARPFIGIFVGRIARESLERTLTGLRANLTTRRPPRL